MIGARPQAKNPLNVEQTPAPDRPFPRIGRICALFVSAGAALSADNAQAEDFFIDDGDVEGLIAAVNDANSNDEPDTIHLAENSQYLLEVPADTGWGGNGLPRIETNITIEGNGSTIERSSEDGTPNFRFFLLESSTDADLTLINLTLHNGHSSHGGAIRNWGNTLALINCTISNCTAVNNGGAIHSDSGGHITITGSTLTGNTGHRGGAINKHGSGGSVTIIDSTIADNTSTGNDGGGIHFEFGTLTITRSTISGNASLTHSGGGIRHQAGTLHITNSTISGNSANTTGGGIYNNNATVNMIHCTVTGNASGSSGGGLLITGNNFTMSNSIVANSIGGEDVDGQAYNDAGHNIVEDGSGVSDPTSMSGDPMLGPLADNGGPTMTHALLPGSPALANGNCAEGTVDVDQRGVSRPQCNFCDIGAFEFQGSPAFGDLNCDGAVNGADLGLLLSNWGPCDNCDDCPADLNDNCQVDGADLGILLSNWQ